LLIHICSVNPAAHVPLFLYPFLNTMSKTRPFEYLRLTSLGVIGALVKVDDTDVINFLLSTEIIPLCLRTMEMGSELSKTVATFIVQKILLDDVSGVSVAFGNCWSSASWCWLHAPRTSVVYFCCGGRSRYHCAQDPVGCERANGVCCISVAVWACSCAPWRWAAS
jgi:hypothetical protein